MKIFIILLFSIITIIKAQISDNFEEHKLKRQNYYKNVTNYSDGKIKLEYHPERGALGVALKDIEVGDNLLTIPKEFIVCNMNLFPFKEEIYQALKLIPKDIYREGNFITTYALLYYFYAQKEEIKKYIQTKKLEKYYNYNEVSDTIINSLPYYTPNFAYFEKVHFEAIDINQDLNILVFKTVIDAISKSEHKNHILPWISNLDNFRWMLSITKSRSHSFSNDYYILLNNLQPKNIEYSHNYNLHLNNNLEKDGFHLNCLISYLDLFNHHQNKYADSRDNVDIFSEVNNNKLYITTRNKFTKEEEIAVNYHSFPKSSNLLLNYGFILDNNIFDRNAIQFVIDKKLSISQVELCIMLDCIKREKFYTPRKVEIDFYYSTIEENILNYGRVRLLKGNFDVNKFYKLFLSKATINLDNEIGAWLFYFNTVHKNLDKNLAKNVLDYVYATQYYKNIQNRLSKTLNTMSEHKKWGYYKIFEYIYQMRFNEIRVYFRQMLVSANYIILNSNKDLIKLRKRYI